MNARRWWIYKCNSPGRPSQIVHGDWEDFFSAGKADEWGSTELLPALAQLKVGDSILAYQTNRNELVGLAIVRGWQKTRRHSAVILKPIERFGVKVRPLKQSDGRIARIRALRPGPIKTLYDITAADAARLLRAAANKKRS